MSRYIDAEGLNLYDDLFMSDDTINKNGVYVRYRAVENLIKNAPTADVQEVKHGKWIDKGRGYGWYKECSNCSYKNGYPMEDFKYCPNCGAKMDEKENEK